MGKQSHKLNRRGFLRTMGVAFTIPTVATLASSSGDNCENPNLLIIQTDEHNFRTLGCYRETLSPEQAFMWGKEAIVETPQIDWLARHGALCTKYYATTPVCSPSRASFLTGQYPQNTAVVKNDIPMRDDVITFAEILRQNGYATGYAGKWHVDGLGRPQWSPKRKFGFEDNKYMFNRGHWKQLEETPEGPRVKARGPNGPSYNVAGADEKSFTTDFLADKTVEFIEAHKGQPFCHMLSIPDPHGPDTVRPPYNKMYAKMTFQKPRTFDKPEELVPQWASKAEKCGYGQAKYYGMVKCIDDNVGKILKCLRDNQLMDNTIVVFTSDHGDLRGEHHRQNKGVPLEASAKVPFVIYYPQKIKAGTVVNQAIGTVDFLPTILNLIGIKTAGREEGRDASALFMGADEQKKWQDIAFVRGAGQNNQENWLAAFTSRYKLIVSPQDKPWLIDMQQDPDELKNYCDDPEYRETIRKLAQELIVYGKKYQDQRTTTGKVAADLKWCATGTGKYVAPDRSLR